MRRGVENATGAGMLSVKSEIRSTKYETNSNDKNPNDKNCFEHLNFGIVSDFEF